MQSSAWQPSRILMEPAAQTALLNPITWLQKLVFLWSALTLCYLSSTKQAVHANNAQKTSATQTKHWPVFQSHMSQTQMRCFSILRRAAPQRTIWMIKFMKWKQKMLLLHVMPVTRTGTPLPALIVPFPEIQPTSAN
jgi:hypothetical protein